MGWPAIRLGGHFQLEWRNWQTRETQNLVAFTGREGSTPSSSTNPKASGLSRLP